MTDDGTDQKTQPVQPIDEDLINRIVATIEMAWSNGIGKNKLVKFLKKQPTITENDIYIAYTRYFEKHARCALY